MDANAVDISYDVAFPANKSLTSVLIQVFAVYISLVKVEADLMSNNVVVSS